MEQEIKAEIAKMLTILREKKPLVHHITNYVTVNDCANATLAIGASPIMADDIDEAGHIAALSSALVLNMGTLNSRSIGSMLSAGKEANRAGVPVVVDPVGAGFSPLRNNTVNLLLEQVQPAVIRGNLSEIKYIACLPSHSKGVDADIDDTIADREDAIPMAKQLANQLQAVIAITGATDLITDGKRACLLRNGHPMLSAVTGTGCLTSSLIGAFCGIGYDTYFSAIAGVLTTCIAGEIAYEQAGHLGTGSFHIALIDAISTMTPELLLQKANITMK